MREKQLRLIVTFNTTTGAMAMEKACKSENIPGRLIPGSRQSQQQYTWDNDVDKSAVIFNCCFFVYI